MIVVDANYFVRAMVRPVTPLDTIMAQTAETLFRRVKRGEDVMTTTDAVIAEVVFALQRHYGLTRADIAARLRPMLQLRGFKLPTKRLCLTALDLWETSPKISFVDALAAAQARNGGRALATFDQDLGKVAAVTLWQPPAPVSQNGSKDHQ